MLKHFKCVFSPTPLVRVVNFCHTLVATQATHITGKGDDKFPPGKETNTLVTGLRRAFLSSTSV